MPTDGGAVAVALAAAVCASWGLLGGTGHGRTDRCGDGAIWLPVGFYGTVLTPSEGPADRPTPIVAGQKERSEGSEPQTF